MREANVVLVEDDEFKQELVERFLDRGGHSVTHKAATLPEALGAVDAIVAGEIPCDVVILDGNLGNGSPGAAHDAEQVMGRIREYELGVKVIGFSASMPLSERGIPVDTDVDKAEASKLPEVISGF